MPKWLAWSGALLVLGTSAFAQPKATPAPPEPSLWDHNGSVVSLIAQGAAREFHYKEPRPGVLDTGARPGSLLFRGKQYTGAAFMFDRRCGQVSYAVSGPILDNDQRVVLTGEAPRSPGIQTEERKLDGEGHGAGERVASARDRRASRSAGAGASSIAT
jgi:hypothetical protein